MTIATADRKQVRTWPYALRFGVHNLIGILLGCYLYQAGVFSFSFSAIADVFVLSQDWFGAFLWSIFFVGTIVTVGLAVQKFVRDHHTPLSRREKFRFALLSGVSWLVAVLLALAIMCVVEGENPLNWASTLITYEFDKLVIENGHTASDASLRIALTIGLVLLFFYLVVSVLTYFVAGMFSRLFSKVAFAFARRFGRNGFQRIVRLRRAAVLAALIVMVPLATAALQEKLDPPPQAAAELTDDGTLIIEWQGEVVPGMAAQLREAFEKYADQSQRVELYLNSGGGDFAEGERVIELLQEIRLTHKLVTVVENGNWCASMCVAIYLQGEERYAAAASIWVLHEATEALPDGTVRAHGPVTQHYFEYFLAVGVSSEWLQTVLAQIGRTNLWLTGQDMLAGGVVTQLLDYKTERPEIEA